MVAPPSNAREFRVFWQYRPGKSWQSATFLDRDEAMACFFRWMSRGVPVQWWSGSATC